MYLVKSYHFANWLIPDFFSPAVSTPRIAAVLVGGTTPDSTAMARNQEYNLDGQIDHVDFPNGNMVSIKMTFFECICILIEIVNIYIIAKYETYINIRYSTYIYTLAV